MSYIHDALKKAQAEKALGKESYGGIATPRRKRKFSVHKKAILWAIPGLMFLLAFAAYSWWDSGEKSREMDPTHNRSVNTSLSASVGKPMPTAPGLPAKNRQNVQALYKKARVLHQRGRLPEAGTGYQNVIAIDPGHVQALNNLGVLHLHEKNYQAAVRCFLKANHLKPDYVDPCYNLACVFAATGQSDRGLLYLRKAIAMDPGVREWARKDSDLDPLRSLSLFQEMVRVTKNESF